MHAPGTVWRQSVRRVTRRSDTFQRTHRGSDYVLVLEAVRTANSLAFRAGITKLRAT